MAATRNVHSTSVVILAAGSSGRMIIPKPFLLYDRATTFLEKIIQSYLDFPCKEIVVVVNPDFHVFASSTKTNDIAQNTNIIVNDSPRKGRLHSLIIGLKALKHPSNCFVQNVDNPFVTSYLLQKLYDNKSDDHYITPVLKGKGGHPVLLNERIIDHLINSCEPNFTLKEILTGFKRRKIEVKNPDILLNINTADDYKKSFAKKLSI